MSPPRSPAAGFNSGKLRLAAILLSADSSALQQNAADDDTAASWLREQIWPSLTSQRGRNWLVSEDRASLIEGQ